MAGKLTLMFNDETLGEYPLDRESLVIGRRPESDIQIDNLAVSGRHARVLSIMDDAFLEDLDSTNGTFVNGKRVKKHPLADGDVITIGKHSLRYEAEAGARAGAAAEGGFAETIVVGPGTSPLRQQASAEDEARAREAAGEGPGAAAGGVAANVGPARLRLVTREGSGKELPLTKALTTLGKPGVQVAAISRRQNGDYLVHVDGGTGDRTPPLVNGSPIGHKSQRLEHEDVIEVAGVKMQYLQD